MLMLHLGQRAQIIATCLLMLIYWTPMHFCGDYTADGNFAEMVDRAVLGSHRDGVYWDEQGEWHFASWYHYTWLWSSLTFGVTVMLGCFAGQIIKDGSNLCSFTALRLAVISLALLALGYLHSMHIPVNKHLWTTSMTLISGGWCWALMALFYWLVDVKGWSRGLQWLNIYGSNSIVAYMLGEVVNFRSVVQSVSYGLQPHLGEWYNVWITFGNYLVIFLILRGMYKARMFVKI
jgi:predicted acyltransferase